VNPEDRGLVIAAGRPRRSTSRSSFPSRFHPAEQERLCRRPVGSTRFDSKNLMYVATEDELLKDREFVLYLKEGGAYGFFCAARGTKSRVQHADERW